MKLTGLPVIYGISPYAEEAVASHPLGTIGYTNDGRKFRYAKFGSALSPGYLVQSAVEVTGNEDLTPSAAVAGATEVTLTPGANAVANLYAEGYLVVTKTAGNGIYYRIDSHPALVNGTANTIKLEDALTVAITASSRIDLVPNQYSGVILNPEAATSRAVGVPIISTTSGYYGWIQTAGPGPVIADEDAGVAVGDLIVSSNNTDGCVENGGTETQQPVGIALTGIASAEHGLAMLNLD